MKSKAFINILLGFCVLSVTSVLQAEIRVLTDLEMSKIWGAWQDDSEGGPEKGDESSKTDNNGQNISHTPDPCDKGKDKRPDPKDPVLVNGGKLYLPYERFYIQARGQNELNGLALYYSYTQKTNDETTNMGYGWTNPLVSIKIYADGDTLTVVDETGRLYVFDGRSRSQRCKREWYHRRG